MIKITKEKEVNRELLESALTIVIDDDIIKPTITTENERVIGYHSGSPEVEYNYKDKGYRLTLFPDYFYGIIAFQVVVFIIALVNAYYLKKQYEERQKAHNERFGDLADRMNKLFGEDWSNLK